jgi:MFS family permease
LSCTPAQPRRAIAANCLASLFWSFNFGVGATLASVHLEKAGYSNMEIGLNTGVYYLGIAVAAALVPWLIRHWGRGCILLGMVVSGASVAAFPYYTGLVPWFTLRFLNGVGGALSLIPLETLVNLQAPADKRSRNFGFYAFSVALGMALGTAIGMEIYPSTPELAFLLGGVVVVPGCIVVAFWQIWPEKMPEEESSSGPLPFRRIFFCLGSAYSQGFLEGGMMALLPVYLLVTIGLSTEQTGWLMSCIMIGVILLQVPLASFSDKFGRTRVLLACHAITILGLCFTPLCRGPSFGLAFWLILTGACSAAFYPLGLALLGEQTPRSGLARANAWYLGINCMGSLSGPILCGMTADLFGARSMFAAGLVAVAAVPCIGLLLHWRAVVARPAVGGIAVEREAA